MSYGPKNSDEVNFSTSKPSSRITFGATTTPLPCPLSRNQLMRQAGFRGLFECACCPLRQDGTVQASMALWHSCKFVGSLARSVACVTVRIFHRRSAANTMRRKAPFKARRNRARTSDPHKKLKEKSPAVDLPTMIPVCFRGSAEWAEPC